MKYRRLGRSGLYTTEITLGTMMFGDMREKGTTPEEATRIIDAYIERGGNHIDTANVYVQGKSEEIIGKALKGKRNSVILATKCYFPIADGVNEKGLSRYNIMRSVEGSLNRLRTDHIDLLYMHCWDPVTPIDESLRAFEDLVTSGKVRYIGVSNFKAWQLMKALATSGENGWNRFIGAQYQYSLVVRDIEDEYLDLFEQEGLGLLPWGPLGGGFLTGKYKRGERPAEGRIATHPDHTEESWNRRNTERNWDIIDEVGRIAEKHDVSYAQVALAWTLHRPTVASTIIGARTLTQLEDNLGATEIKLDEDDMTALNKASNPPERYPYRFMAAYGRSAG